MIEEWVEIHWPLGTKFDNPEPKAYTDMTENERRQYIELRLKLNLPVPSEWLDWYNGKPYVEKKATANEMSKEELVNALTKASIEAERLADELIRRFPDEANKIMKHK